MSDSDDYQESTTINFDWRVRGLRDIFEGSKDEGKPKAIRSPKFGGGLWQLLFYSSDSAESGHISLFLTCEPSAREKEEAIDNKWTRKGAFNFTLEIKNNAKTMLIAQKDAANRSFSWQGANWGWQQFASRNSVYQHNTLRMNDSMIVSCRVSSSPLPVPAECPPITHQSVPIKLVNVMGSLLDDPAYSDVEFVISHGSMKSTKRSIFAASKVLRRYEYFESMFGMGFAEGSALTGNSAEKTLTSEFDDSDDEESYDTDWDMSVANDLESDGEKQDEGQKQTNGDEAKNDAKTGCQDGGAASNTQDITMGTVMKGNNDNEHHLPSLPDVDVLSRADAPGESSDDIQFESRHEAGIPPAPQVPHMKVVVNDAAYTTYRAVLLYIYTDRIYFTPLASSFLCLSKAKEPASNEPKTRRDWIETYMKKHPKRNTPVSAKAVFRLADKLGMVELRAKAFQHIIKSLTIENVPYEMFSSFSAIFSDVRKNQIDFFLRHWNEIRSSAGMAAVWQQIRAGRHPGFEEVWPRIAMNLEFKPATETPDDQNRVSA